MNWLSQLEIWKERFLIPLDDPGSRLFHVNILMSVLLIAGWLYFSKKDLSWSQLKKLILRKKYWWNRSTKLDYKVYFANSLLKIFLFIPLLDFSFHISRFVSEGLVNFQGDFMGLSPHGFLLFLFTTCAFVWDDFLRFSHHWLMHKVPFLWKLHETHHSARILTPVTLFRNHPLESALATIRNSLSLGVATGIFVFLFEARLTVITLLGINMFGFLFNLLGANLRHSHIPLHFPVWVEKIFISPVQHQIHHSLDERHFDKNFGVSLAIWDQYLTSSWISSQNTKKLKFGLSERSRQNFWKEFLW